MVEASEQLQTAHIIALVNAGLYPECKYCGTDVDEFDQHIIYGSLGAAVISGTRAAKVKREFWMSKGSEKWQVRPELRTSMITKEKYLSDSEVNILRNSIDLNTRNGCLIMLALETGARAQELLNLKESDIDSFSSTVFITGLKGSRNREIPLRAEVLASAKRFIPFDIKYRRLEQIWRTYVNANKTFHSLRHTFALNLYQRTKDIKLVQLALGHVSPTSTAVYMDFVYSQDQLRRILLPHPLRT